MAHYAALRYNPGRYGRVTPWAKDWRRRWNRHVGCTVDYRGQGVLYLAYSDDLPKDMRLALQAELEARPNRIRDVLATCAAHTRAFNRSIAAGYRAQPVSRTTPNPQRS